MKYILVLFIAFLMTSCSSSYDMTTAYTPAPICQLDGCDMAGIHSHLLFD